MNVTYIPMGSMQVGPNGELIPTNISFTGKPKSKLLPPKWLEYFLKDRLNNVMNDVALIFDFCLLTGGDGRPATFQQVLAPSTSPTSSTSQSWKVSDLTPVYR